MHAANEVRGPAEEVGAWGEHPRTGLCFEDALAGSIAGPIPPEPHAGGTQHE